MSDPAFVEVEWLDAHGSGTTVFDPDLHHAPVTMFTRGWLMRRDKRGISLCCERFSDEKMCYRGHTFVPASIIVAVRTLKVTSR